ncbi:MAG: hypothetical protein PVH88_01990 [Ignavibacteria bacterium]|jgi:hypothetical protein
MKNVLTNKPVGIIKTMPVKWVKELPFGYERWEKNILAMNDYVDHTWVFSLSNKPKHEVLYFYLLIQGEIRYRANIIGYLGPGEVKCYGGNVMFSKVWVQIGSPILKLNPPVEMKGFRGFRYTDQIYV